MSDSGPSDQQPENYRHQHQDIRLGGGSGKQWGRRSSGVREGSLLIPNETPTAKGEVLGDVAIRVVDGIAERYASGKGYTPPPLVKIDTLTQRLTDDFASILGPDRSRRDSLDDLFFPAPEELEARHPNSEFARRQMQEMLLRRANALNDRAGRSPADQKAADEASDAFLAFRYGDQSPLSDPRHALHDHWLEQRAEIRSRLRIEEMGPDDEFPDDPKGLEEINARVRREVEQHEFSMLMSQLDVAWFEQQQDPTRDNHARLVLARKALKAHPLYTSSITGQLDEAKDLLRQAGRVAPEPERKPIDILADVGITSTPTGPAETFTDIWCIFCDRDQLDFIGTTRNESRVEIALTLHAAFATMIRMSGFDDEVLIASGIDLDDPCLETLATFLNERTNDHYSFGPYVTSIDERLFNFLQ